MQGTILRSQLRTNIPGDTRISGRFNTDGTNTPTILEGKNFTVSKPSPEVAGHYIVTFGPTTTDKRPVLGLVAGFASAVVATPNPTNSRWVVVHQILTPAGVVVTGSGGPVGSVVLGAINQAGTLANLTADDDICFEFIVRNTEITS